jgi:hypothetical protein
MKRMKGRRRKMRDRLIELIENTHWNWVKDSLDKKKINLCASKSLNETIADALLEDGWIRPPVKVGDVVYVIDDGDEGTEPYVLDVQINGIGIDICGVWITMDLPLGFKRSCYIGAWEIGKTVFLTRAEAEKALKGGE